MSIARRAVVCASKVRMPPVPLRLWNCRSTAGPNAKRTQYGDGQADTPIDTLTDTSLRCRGGRAFVTDRETAGLALRLSMPPNRKPTTRERTKPCLHKTRCGSRPSPRLPSRCSSIINILWGASSVGHQVRAGRVRAVQSGRAKVPARLPAACSECAGAKN